MEVGEQASFVVAPQYAYGSAGVPPVIPADATLSFEVHINYAPTNQHDLLVMRSSTRINTFAFFL